MRDLVAIVCFFASGFVGLVYEICWIRKASLAFGATTLALSTVVAVFFAGLALGSYLFGLYSSKTTRPLKTYALLEISLGIIALANPAMFSWAEKLYGLFYPAIMHNFTMLSLARLFIITLLILPPTVLMGATLPLFCRQYVVSRERISLSVGLLYGLNTLGAAIGCLVCGFYLIPLIGVNKTIWLGGLVNILIGLTVSRMKITAVSSYVTNDKPGFERDKTRSRSKFFSLSDYSTTRDVIAVFVLFFLTGFVALGNEILWTRYFSLIIHNTVYTYTLTLAIILFGIVLGSILVAGFTDKTRRRAFIFGTVHVLNGISVLALLMLPAAWWYKVIDTKNFSAHLCIFAFILLLPAILSGVSFPLAIRMVVVKPSLAGVRVGKMTAVNTLGAITGSLAVGFILLPQIGLQKSLLLTTALSLFIGFISWFLLERSLRSYLKYILAALSFFVWLSIPYVTATHLPADFLAGRHELIDFREGINSNLAVVRESNNDIQLTIDRMWQGKDRKNHQILAAHVPMLLHQHPKEILVIGMGVGQTASRFLLYDMTRLDCVDIEGELFELVRKHFESSWMDDERVRFIIEDGRNYLAHTNSKYDIISIEVGQTFRPGLASFYTVDFYRYARNKLNDNGIVCQFVPISFIGPDEFRSVIRSFLQVFPESVLWYNTSELLLLGSVHNRLRFSSERLRMLNFDEAINKDLQFAYWGGPAHWVNQKKVFLAGFLCGPESLARLSSQVSSYYDDLPRLEYLAARSKQRFEKTITDLIRRYLEPVQLVLNEKINGETSLQIQAIREQNLQNIAASSLLRRYISRCDVVLLHKAVQLNPNNVAVNIELGNYLANLGKALQAIPYYSTALQIDPCNADAHYGMGNALRKLAQDEKAIEHYLLKIKLEHKPSPDVRNNLAWMLATHKEAAYYDPEQALLFAKQACELTQYKKPALLDTVAEAYAAAGKIHRAIETSKKALELARSSGQNQLAKEIESHLRSYKTN